jgi:hypothetical protein
VPDFSTLKISTARSTTQTIAASRRESVQAGQGDRSVNAPQISQKRMCSRACKIVSAKIFTAAESVCTRCSAMRSAERGPTPGSLLNVVMSAVMEAGSIGRMMNYEV